MIQNHKLPGLVQWFQIGDKENVQRTIEILNALRINEFRLLFSWADWESPGGPQWFDYFVSEICSKTKVKLVPDLFYTPIHKARSNAEGEKKTSHPPQNLKDYSLFAKEIIVRYGKHFDWIQLWNEPNWKPYWEWDLDPEAKLFCEMARMAAEVAHSYGKKVALGGLSPYEPEYITQIYKNGLLFWLDAVGIHYSPSWDSQRRKWYGFKNEVETAKAHLRGLGSGCELWIAETGFSTMGKDQRELEKSYKAQIEFFEEARLAAVSKIFWYSAIDQDPDHKTDNEINMNDLWEYAAYHFGLITTENLAKPLFEHWKKLAAAQTKFHIAKQIHR